MSRPPASGGTAARLFSDTSLWNTVKSASTYWALADSVLSTQTYTANTTSYDHPTYFAQASDPVWTFHLGAGWGWSATSFTANAPENITEAPGGDSVLGILLTDGRLLDMYGIMYTAGIDRPNHSCTALYYGLSDGVNGPGFGDQGTGQAIGTTAIGSPQSAGTILARDILAGVIPHALFMAMDPSAEGGAGTGGPGYKVPPAVAGDDVGGPGPIPQGGLMLIPAGTTQPGGLSPGGVMLWNACKTYGVYCCDTLGGFAAFYGDGSATVANALDYLVDCTPVGRQLRLVKTW
jgi:hypothetical protein